MDTHVPTTPFGRRPVTLGQIAAQLQVRRAVDEAGKPGSNAPAAVNKWQVCRTLTEIRDRLGVSDRSLSVLNALLTFHPETALSLPKPRAVASEDPADECGEGAAVSCDLIVFPSNRQLGQRAHGMAPATLWRHLTALVQAGLIIRRDSPNGKRYARRGQDGAVSLAFGFELTPLVARAEEFEALAAEVQAERKALRLARERITLARRDIAKMIMLGMEEGLSGDWEGLHGHYMSLVGTLRRSSTLAEMQNMASDLEAFAAEILKHLELFINSSIHSANESHSEHHKQNSKPDSSESEPAFKKDKGGERQPVPETVEFAENRKDGGAGTGTDNPRSTLGTPLPMVLEACPDILDYITGREGQGASPPSWAEFLKAAELVRAMLGISPDAWQDAVETMGQADASIVVAAILQKGDEVRFPGGYLRALTEKKRAGQFSVGPILMALIGTRLKAMRGGKGEA